jgi:superfamily II DNA helicase RecQ
MKNILLIFVALSILTSCGDKDVDFSPINDQIDEALTEFGNNPSEGILELNPEIISNACDVFEYQSNNVGSHLQEMFSSLSDQCENIDEDSETALIGAASFANTIFTEFVENENPALCLKLGKRAVRKVLTLHRREQKIANDHEKSELFTLRNSLTKERLDRIIRKLNHHGCIDHTLSTIEYDFNDVAQTYNISENYIVNGSFEIFKNINDDQKGTSSLQDGWTIVDSSNVPGWRIKEVNDSGDSKNCSFLEIQTSGVVSTAPHGNQIVELDSHCKRSNGSKVSGNANVEIFQKFPVEEVGTYSLKMKAQKRNGRYGKLESAVFQRNRQKTYVEHSLADQAQWEDVCQEVEIDDTNKYVKITIRDNAEDRATYGVLLDNVEFVKGGCVQ